MLPAVTHSPLQHRAAENLLREVVRDDYRYALSHNSNGAGLHSDHQPFMLQGIPYISASSNLDC